MEITNFVLQLSISVPLLFVICYLHIRHEKRIDELVHVFNDRIHELYQKYESLLIDTIRHNDRLNDLYFRLIDREPEDLEEYTTDDLIKKIEEIIGKEKK